jgi:hypothetical protein
VSTTSSGARNAARAALRAPLAERPVGQAPGRLVDRRGDQPPHALGVVEGQAQPDVSAGAVVVEHGHRHERAGRGLGPPRRGDGDEHAAPVAGREPGDHRAGRQRAPRPRRGGAVREVRDRLGRDVDLVVAGQPPVASAEHALDQPVVDHR